MPLVNIPGVGRVNFPDTMTNEQISTAIREQILPRYAREPQVAPTMPLGPATPTPPAFEPGSGSSLLSGVYGLGGNLYSAAEGVGSLAGSERLERFGREGRIRSEQAAEEALPQSERVSFEQAEGVRQNVRAAGQALGTSLPSMVPGLAGAAAGAGIGTAIMPGPGTLAGAIIGGTAASIPQFFGANRQRQIQESGAVQSELAALGTAVPQALSEAVVDNLTLRLGRILGIGGEAVARELLPRIARGIGVGAAANVPAEVLQQAMERAQAGLDILSPEAMAEYREAGTAAAVVGGGLGGTVAGVFGGAPGPSYASENPQVRRAIEQIVAARGGAQPAPGTIELPAGEQPVEPAAEVPVAEPAAAPAVVRQPDMFAQPGTVARPEVAPPVAAAPEIAPAAPTPSPAPVSFTTALGSTYEVNEEGQTIRTKRSPGRGQGTTYPPHNALFVDPAEAENILEDLRGGGTYRFVVEDQGRPRAINPGESIAGRRVALAVFGPNDEFVRYVPAQTRPAVGLSPVELRYDTESDGTIRSNRHIGNPITEIRGAAPASSPAAIPEAAPAPKPVPEAKPDWRMGEPVEAAPEVPDVLPQNVKEIVDYMRKGRRLDKPKGQVSLVQAIINAGGLKDTGGDLKQMMGGTVKTRPGLINKKGGLQFDRMSEILTGRGYFVDLPTDSELLDAINEELAGRAVNYGTTEDIRGRQLAEAARDLQREMDIAGVSPQNTDAEIARALGIETPTQPRTFEDIEREDAARSAFSARSTEARAESPAAAAKVERAQEKARATVNKFLDDLRSRGRQARIFAGDLDRLLRDRTMTAEQIYRGFMVADTLAKTIPARADYRLKFVQDLVVDNEEAGRASGAEMGQRAQGRVVYPEEGSAGLIELSLAKDMLPFLNETAAHEGFHILQTYFAEYDKPFADRINKSFKEDMKISDLEPSIKRRLQALKPPGSKVSYYDSLVQGLGDKPLSVKEAQAYAFGSLVDASMRGKPTAGILPPFQRFVLFAKEFLAKLKSALNKDGFESAADLLLSAQRRGARMTQAAPTAEGAAYSGRTLPPTIEVDGVTRPTTNSEGRQIHPTEEGVRNFWRWFGDSKVVDAEGRPQVVYHGTSKDKDFASFNVPKRGAWFAADPAEASSYANENDSRAVKYDWNTRKFVDVNTAARVIPVYLSIKNPVELTQGQKDRLSGKTGEENYARVQGDVFSELRAAGADGVQAAPGVWVALKDPTQVKSAIGNLGTFKPTDKRTQYSARRVPDQYAARATGQVAGLPAFGQRVNPQTPSGTQQAELNVQYDVVSRALGKRFGRFISPAKFESFFMKFQDKMLPVGRMIDDIRAAGGNVAVAMDTYLKEDLLQGKVATMLEKRTKDLYNPLVKALADSGLSIQDFENFLYARHAPERNAYVASINPDMPDGGSGLTNKQAEEMMKEFQQQGKTAKLTELAKMFDAIIVDTNKLRVEAGLTPDFTQVKVTEDGRMLPNYQFYAPLRNAVEESPDGSETVKEFRPKTGKALGARGREDRRVTGRERMAGDILAHAMMQNTQAVIRSEQNKVGQSFLALIRANPEQSAGYAEVISSAPLRTTIVNGIVKTMPDPFYKNDPDVLVVKENGKEVAIRIKDDNVARAMTGASALSPTSKNILVQGMAAVNRFLAKVNTAYNPEFLITNFARDLQTFGINVKQFDIDGLTRDVMGDLKGSMSGIRDVTRGTNNNPEMARYFQRFRELGGTTDMYGAVDIEDRVAEINKVMNEIGTDTKSWKEMAQKATGPVIKLLEDYNTIVENGIRTALFKNLVERGFNEEKAAQAAKNITVNFSKGGENRVLMNALYLFYNASLQGSMAMVNAIGRSPKVRKIVAGVVVAGVLQDVINSMLSDVDDDEDKVYDKIPDHVLKRSFVMMDPFKITERGYFSFPMPYGFNAFFNMGREMSKAARGATSPMKAAGSIVGTFVDSFNPVGGDSILNFVAPTILDPVVDISQNRDFAGRPIVPERRGFGAQAPESQKYWNNTFGPYVAISEFLNEVTGGTRVIPGAVDISPNIIQYAVNYATGGVGKFVERTYNTVTGTIPDALRGDLSEVDVKGIPLFRSLYGNVTTRSDTERYMERMEEVLRVRQEIRDASQYGQSERIDAAMRRYPGQVEIMETFNRISRERAQISQQINAINRNPNIDADSKKEMVKLLRDQQNALVVVANQLYNQSVERRQ